MTATQIVHLEFINNCLKEQDFYNKEDYPIIKPDVLTINSDSVLIPQIIIHPYAFTRKIKNFSEHPQQMLNYFYKYLKHHFDLYPFKGFSLCYNTAHLNVQIKTIIL